MSKKRKTFDVKDLVTWINDKLASPAYSNDEKYGMINALDHVLNQSGNYAGYGYLDDYNSDNWTMTQDVRRVYYTKS